MTVPVDVARLRGERERARATAAALEAEAARVRDALIDAARSRWSAWIADSDTGSRVAWVTAARMLAAYLVACGDCDDEAAALVEAVATVTGDTVVAGGVWHG